MARQRRLRLAAIAATVALLSGCASLAPQSAPPPQPRSGGGAPGEAALPPPAPGAEGAEPAARDPSSRGAPAPRAAASAQLLSQARAERAAGRYSAAASAVERALRLEPNDASLWLELAEIHLADGNRQQAEAMARKALTLAGGDGSIESRAERVIRAAAASR